MASAFAHAAASTAIGVACGLSRKQWRLLLLGACCAVMPDLDSLGFWAGIAYDHPLGHRGASHSVAAAVLVGLASHALLSRDGAAWERHRIGVYCFLATLSHGLLDAMTNGGLGVAFFFPFSNERYFFPVRPIEVSPLEPTRFFTWRAVRILVTEALWVGIPSVLLGAGMRWYRRRAGFVAARPAEVRVTSRSDDRADRLNPPL